MAKDVQSHGLGDLALAHPLFGMPDPSNVCRVSRTGADLLLELASRWWCHRVASYYLDRRRERAARILPAPAEPNSPTCGSRRLGRTSRRRGVDAADFRFSMNSSTWRTTWTHGSPLFNALAGVRALVQEHESDAIAGAEADSLFLHDLPADAYHADRDALSCSLLKPLLTSPAHFRAGLVAPPKNSPAKEFGSLVHLLLLQPHLASQELAVYPGIANSRDLDFKAFLACNTHRLAVDEPTFAEARRLANKVSETAYKGRPLGEFIEESMREVSIYFTEPVTGLRLRIRPDAYHPEITFDLKTTRQSTPEAFARDAVEFGYDLQAFMYGLGRRLYEGAQAVPFVFIAAETAQPHSIGVFEAGSTFLENGAAKFQACVGRSRPARTRATGRTSVATRRSKSRPGSSSPHGRSGGCKGRSPGLADSAEAISRSCVPGPDDLTNPACPAIISPRRLATRRHLPSMTSSPRCSAAKDLLTGSRAGAPPCHRSSLRSSGPTVSPKSEYAVHCRSVPAAHPRPPHERQRPHGIDIRGCVESWSGAMHMNATESQGAVVQALPFCLNRQAAIAFSSFKPAFFDEHVRPRHSELRGGHFRALPARRARRGDQKHVPRERRGRRPRRAAR